MTLDNDILAMLPAMVAGSSQGVRAVTVATTVAIIYFANCGTSARLGGLKSHEPR